MWQVDYRAWKSRSATGRLGGEEAELSVAWHRRPRDRLPGSKGLHPNRVPAPVEQAVGAMQLKAPPDLVELLAALVDDPPRLQDVAEFLDELWQGQPPARYLLCLDGGHSRSSLRGW